jgi:hypothetical protein
LVTNFTRKEGLSLSLQDFDAYLRGNNSAFPTIEGKRFSIIGEAPDGTPIVSFGENFQSVYET